jgi:hypothetical protein
VGSRAGVAPQPANFSAFLNGEAIRGQDLVSWVTLGAFDLPTSESAPITSVAGRRLSFWLLPYNYFDEVRRSSQYHAKPQHACMQLPAKRSPAEPHWYFLHADARPAHVTEHS